MAQFGGFEGDEAKRATLDSLLAKPFPADDSDPGALVDILGTLPQQAEASVFNHWALQPDTDGARTRWFEALFRWCFRGNDVVDNKRDEGASLRADEEHKDDTEMAHMFVVNDDPSATNLKSGGTNAPNDELVLNSERFHILKRIIGCSARLGAQGVDFLERYLKSTSQRFRRSYIQSMCGSPHLSNDRLFELQSNLPLRTRKAISLTVAAKHRELRVPFIERVLTEDHSLSQRIGLSLRTKASSEFVRQHYVNLPDFVFCDWHLHGVMYSSWVSDKVQQQRLAKNPLSLGHFFTMFLDRVSVKTPEERVQVTELVQRFKPYTVSSQSSAQARLELQKLSSGGALNAERLARQTGSDFVVPVYKASHFQLLPTKKKLAILKDDLISGQDGQPFIKPESWQVVLWITQQALEDPSHHGRVAQQLVEMAVSVFATVSREVLWDFVSLEKPSPSRGWYSAGRRSHKAKIASLCSELAKETPSIGRVAAYSTFKLCHTILDVFVSTDARSPSLKFMYQLLLAWWEAHQRHLPSVGEHLRQLGRMQGATAGLAMWNSWFKSLTEPHERGFQIAMQRHRYKTWVARANPERGSAAELWGKLRGIVTDRLLQAATLASDGFAAVATLFGEDQIGAKWMTDVEKKKFQVVLGTMRKLYVDPMTNNNWGFDVPEDVRYQLKHQFVQRVENSVVDFVQVQVTRLLDFSSPQLHWFSHATRLDLLRQLLADGLREDMSPRAVGKFMSVVAQGLNTILLTKEQFTLTHVDGKPGNDAAGADVVIAVRQQTLQTAAAHLVGAMARMLSATKKHFTLEDSQVLRDRIRSQYRVLLMWRYPIDQAMMVGEPDCGWDRCFDPKNSHFTVKAILDEIRKVPAFLQREEGQRIVLPLLEFLIDCANGGDEVRAKLAKLHIPTLLTQAPSILTREFVVPRLFEEFSRRRQAAPSDANESSEGSLGVNTADLYQCSPMTHEATLAWLKKRASSNSDSAQRMCGLVALMTQSLQEGHSKVVSDVLEFVAVKIRNESGLVRPSVYQWISTHLASIVELTLPGLSGEVSPLVANFDPSNVVADKHDAAVQQASAEAIVKALQTMLHDDMSKADSVAKKKFVDAANAVFQTIVNGLLRDAPEWRSVARVWIGFAMRVQWDVSKRFHGPEALRIFCPDKVNVGEPCERDWPHRVTDLKGVLGPWLSRETMVPKEQVAKYVATVLAKQLQRSSDTDTAMTVVTKLDLTVECISEIKASEAASWAKRQEQQNQQESAASDAVPGWLSQPFVVGGLEDGIFFPRDRRMLLTQLKWLVQTLGYAWVQSKIVLDILSAAVVGLQHESCPRHHFEQSYALLQVMAEKSTVITQRQVRPLTVALCKAAARLYAGIRDWAKQVNSGIVPIAQQLATSIINNLDPNATSVEARAAAESTLQAGPQFDLAFMLRATHLQGSKTFVNSLKKPRDHAVRAKVSADPSADIQMLLSLCPSAVHLDVVQEFLLHRRSDILQGYLRDLEARFAGVFAEGMRADGTHGDERDMSKFRLNWQRVKLALPRLRAVELAALGQCDLADLNDPNIGLEQKGKHVSRLLALPSTGLKEHVALQDSLRQRLLTNPQDGAAAFLLEKVLQAAYESDQKVWLLAHLLSPHSVSTNPHRDTANIIQRLPSEFSAGAVVSVLRLLLSERRRGAVKILVHRTIVRTLASLRRGAAAGDTLLDEWELAKLPRTESSSNASAGRLHADVVLELVRAAVRAVTAPGAGSNDTVPAMWTVVEEASSTACAAMPIPALLELLDIGVTHNTSPPLRMSITAMQSAAAIGVANRLSKFSSSDSTLFSAPYKPSDAVSELWRLCKVSSWAEHEVGTVINLYDTHHCKYTLPRVHTAILNLCTWATERAEELENARAPTAVSDGGVRLDNAAAAQDPEVMRTLSIFATLRLLQFTAVHVELSNEDLLAKVLPLAERVIFGRKPGTVEARPLVVFDTSDWILKATSHDAAALTLGVQLYATLLASRLHNAALSLVTPKITTTEQFEELMRESVLKSHPLASRLRDAYSAQVQRLLSLPLSKPAARREAYEVRRGLRQGVQGLNSVSQGIIAWASQAMKVLQEDVLDKPVEDQQHFLACEAASSQR